MELYTDMVVVEEPPISPSPPPPQSPLVEPVFTRSITPL
ncbi:hypothetical protein TcasGA2_TC030944 [Tribolium castaneum]|uniref:Uncharacterized protein n=1 Tax=Tribolium castaneum TaxID=7070 RepID=A0A139W981_TRICA|nr:hypothetical protein TcasGA2_TC030944 [Tribolium castaneum]